MTIAQIDEPTRQKPLRVWPGVVVVVLQWLSWLVIPMVVPDGFAFGALAAFAGGLAILLWWALFSRAPWSERLGAIALMIVALVATPRFLHESVATGNMGLQFFLFVIPGLSLALVVWAVASRRLSTGPRWAAMVVAILLACGAWTLLRSEDMTGDGAAHFTWRWAETSEQRFLARAGDEPMALPPDPEAARTEAEWPGYRGPDRNGAVPGVRIETDWSREPPVELWRRPIGPGTSSFAVRGNLLYTQEQRGDDEVVASYRLASGEPVWRHGDPARFWDSHVGAGPRGTPALAEGRVYALGATGILNALDAGNGAVVWSRNAASDMNATVMDYGVTSSPLVIDDVVIVAVSGRLAAYDLATGEPRWFGPDGGGSYSSPHRLTIDGITHVLLLSGAGATSVAPADGTVLWEHPSRSGILQPAVIAEGDFLISEVEMMATGTRRIAVGHGPGGWTVEERWKSARFKPHFNDVVVHKGHAYGFDGSILACLDVENGERRWKGGRYGHGQLLLLPDQDLLLVLSEKGELALVMAAPDGFTELARLPAIEGRTWNHPVLVGDLLLVRNSQEMAAFRLGGPQTAPSSPNSGLTKSAHGRVADQGEGQVTATTSALTRGCLLMEVIRVIWTPRWTPVSACIRTVGGLPYR